MDYKFNYNSAELYISKYNTYGSRFFLLVDIENNTMFKRIYEHKKTLGYVELNPDEFQEALKNGRV